MNKANGNMYAHISHTHNPLKGKCPHDCHYCYMNKIYNRFRKTFKEPYLDEKELKKNLGKGNFIFIGSSFDMWADNIPRDWILKVLIQTNKYPDNKYLFQTKNPRRFYEFIPHLHDRTIGATIETNKWHHCMGDAPVPLKRILPNIFRTERFITIEPILDFDLEIFVEMLKNANPDYVNIGADSGYNRLPEPPKENILELISELEKFTKVIQKKNLMRLTGG